MKVINLYKVVEKYKDYEITTGAFGLEVFCAGDDYVFDTVEEAREFIDSLYAE